MTTSYWKFKPEDDGSTRVDLLVEEHDRAPGDPIPDVLTVTFDGEKDCPTHTVRSEFLVSAPPPGDA